MLAFEYFDADGEATANGVFIPQTALPGLDAAELDSAVEGKESKAILAILNKLFTYFASLEYPVLGLTISKSSPSGAGLDIINQAYSFTATYLVNHATNTLSTVPLPSSGTNSGLGGLAISAVFPSAAKVAAAGDTGAAGILIPSAELAAYGAPAHADITVSADSRRWFSALFLYMANLAQLRTAEEASAIVSRSVGSATGSSFPTSWIQATNPVSGVAAADVPLRSLISRSFGVTLQLALNQETQKFDVYAVTA